MILLSLIRLYALKKYKMKDMIKRLAVISFFGLFTWFLCYNLILGKPILQNEDNQLLHYLFYGILILLSLYVGVYYGIYPMHIKFSRAILFVIGISAIIMGETMFANDGLNGLYFGDLAKVFGVVVLIVGPTGLIFTKRIHKQKEEKELEIIEV